MAIDDPLQTAKTYQACVVCHAKWFTAKPIDVCPRCRADNPLSTSEAPPWKRKAAVESSPTQSDQKGHPMNDNEAVESRQDGRIVSRSSSTDYVRSRWPLLPPHIREAIVSLVDAGCRLVDEAAASSSENISSRPKNAPENSCEQ